MHLRHRGRRPGPDLPGHRGLQLRLRRPGLHLGLCLHQVGADPAPPGGGGLPAGRGGPGPAPGPGFRPSPLQPDPQFQHHSQVRHRHQPLRRYPVPPGRAVRKREHLQPAEHPVQPRHRVLPGRRHPGQRDLRDLGADHGGGPGRPGRADAIHQPGPQDARGGGVQEAHRARRGQRPPGGGHGLGRLRAHGRLGRGAARPHLRGAAVQRLRGADGGGLRRRRMGRAALPAHRRPSGHPDGGARHHAAGLSAGEQRLVLGRADLVAVHRAGGRATHRARTPQVWTAPRTRSPRSTLRRHRRRPPSGRPRSRSSAAWGGTSSWRPSWSPC